MPSDLDLPAILRRLKPERRTGIRRRLDSDLSFVDGAESDGRSLLLDTCVYVHALRGEMPAAVDEILRTRTLHHSAVAVAELAHRIGSLVPTDRREWTIRNKIEDAIMRIPRHRLSDPTASIWAEAGVLAGIRARIGHFEANRHGLNDAMIFLQARALGAVVLTADIADFDILQQIVPSGRVVFYRTE